MDKDKLAQSQPTQPIPLTTIYTLVVELTNPDKRETALLELR